MSSKVPIGVAHGRFQPLHKGHMDYLLDSKAHCDFIIVGITNPDPAVTAHHETNPHRSLETANPFTYYERTVMIRESLREAGLSWEEFFVVPFPINKPELIRFYVPRNATFFMTIYDDWGRAKRDILQSLGLRVEVLWERDTSHKIFSGTEVRKRIASGEEWESLVPHAVARNIKEMKLAERVIPSEGKEQTDLTTHLSESR